MRLFERREHEAAAPPLSDGSGGGRKELSGFEICVIVTRMMQKCHPTQVSMLLASCFLAAGEALLSLHRDMQVLPLFLATLLAHAAGAFRPAAGPVRLPTSGRGARARFGVSASRRLSPLGLIDAASAAEVLHGLAASPPDLLLASSADVSGGGGFEQTADALAGSLFGASRAFPVSCSGSYLFVVEITDPDVPCHLTRRVALPVARDALLARPPDERGAARRRLRPVTHVLFLHA